jgi:hypothetical protein
MSRQVLSRRVQAALHAGQYPFRIWFFVWFFVMSRRVKSSPVKVLLPFQFLDLESTEISIVYRTKYPDTNELAGLFEVPCEHVLRDRLI